MPPRDELLRRKIPEFLFGPFWTGLERRGVSLAELERCSGLGRPVVGNFTRALTLEEAFRLYDAVIQLTGDETIGLAVAHELSLASLHLLGHVILSSCTLRQSFMRTAGMEPLLHEHQVQTESLAGGRARIGVYSAPLGTAAARMHAQLMAVYLGKFVAFFCPDAAARIVSCLPYPRPRDSTAYEVAFPGGVEFDADGTFVVFPEYALDHERAESDPLLAAQIGVFARDIYTTAGNAEDWTSRACRALRVHPSPRVLTKGQLARSLGVSADSLVRGLAREGSTVSTLMDRVLFERAQRLLRSSTASPAEIAEALGYQEVRSFFRAFRRWSGTTPLAWRAQDQAADPPDSGS